MSRYLSALLVLLVTSGQLAGQERAANVPAELTLEQALMIALENHPAYAVQRATLAAADAQERGTAWWLRLLPTVRIDGNAYATRSRIPSGTDEFGRAIPATSFQRRDSDFGPTFGSVTLFDGGTNLRNARSTRAGVSATRASVISETVQLQAQLTRNYYDAVRTELQIALEERLLESTRLNLDAAQRLLRVGSQDPLDVLTAELGVATAEHSLERARGEGRRARLALKEAMGVDQDAEFTLADELPEVFDPAQLDAETLVAAALRENPGLAEVRASAEQSRYALANATAGRWPTVSASLQTRRGTTQGNSDPLFYLNPVNQTYTVGLNFSFNLFDRFQTSYQIAQARANYARSNESVRARQLQTETEVRGALLDLENAYRALQLQDRTAELSRQRLELSQQKYRLGSLSINDLQSSVDDAYRAEHDALTARFAFATAALALEEAAGVPAP